MIKLFIHTSSKTKFNVAGMLTNISWSGDINTLPRQVEVSVQNANIAGKSQLVNYAVGNTVTFFHGSTELFRGFIFKIDTDESGGQTFTAYDQLIYSAKNHDTLLVKKKSASDVIISLFKKFGIPIGSIEDTSHKISRLVFQGTTLTEIIEKLLEDTKKKNKKSYAIYSSKGKVYMVSREKASKKTISVKSVISASREISIEDVATQVLVTKGSLDNKQEPTFKSHLQKDSTTIGKYGVIQHVESVDDKASLDTMKKTAVTVLNEMKKPADVMSVEFIGDIKCITGNKIEINNQTSGIVGTFYITSDTHTFSGGTHKMSLQLSKKLD